MDIEGSHLKKQTKKQNILNCEVHRLLDPAWLILYVAL